MAATSPSPVESDPFPPKGSANRAVLISNLSLLASDTDLEEVFSFCGKIGALQIRGGDPAAQAVVVFDSRSAQMAALLLNDTSILDQKVSVAPAPEVWSFPRDQNTVPTTSHPAREPGGDDGSSTPSAPPLSAAGASSLVSGLWQRVADTARSASHAVETNEQLWAAVESAEAAAARAGSTVMQTAASAGEKTRATWSGIDSNYHVSEKTSAAVGTVARSTKQGAQTLDAKLGIREKATEAKTAIRHIATELDENLAVSEKTSRIRQSAMDNETIRTGVEVISESWDDLLGRVKVNTQAQSHASRPAPSGRAGEEASAPKPKPNMLDEEFDLPGSEKRQQ